MLLANSLARFGSKKCPIYLSSLNICVVKFKGKSVRLAIVAIFVNASN